MIMKRASFEEGNKNKIQPTDEKQVFEVKYLYNYHIK